MTTKITTTVPTLADLQSAVQRSITQFNRLTEESPVLGWIEKLPPLSPRERLEVYADSWFIRLRESLAEDFPETQRILGEIRFQNLIRDFLDTFPPTSFELVDLGEPFPEFLRERTGDRPWLYDLACLERANCRAFYAAEPAPWSPEALLAMPPDAAGNLNLRRVSSLSLVHSNWDILAVWENGADTASARAANPLHLCVHRDHGDVVVREIPSDEFAALQRVEMGSTLGELLETMPAAGAFLTSWAASEKIEVHS